MSKGLFIRVLKNRGFCDDFSYRGLLCFFPNPRSIASDAMSYFGSVGILKELDSCASCFIVFNTVDDFQGRSRCDADAFASDSLKWETQPLRGRHQHSPKKSKDYYLILLSITICDLHILGLLFVLLLLLGDRGDPPSFKILVDCIT